MNERDVVIGIGLEEACLTIEQVAACGAVDAAWVHERVTEGLLTTAGSGTEWRFTATHLTRVQRMRGIERDFEAAPELAALVADLLEQLDAARRLLALKGLP